MEEKQKPVSIVQQMKQLALQQKREQFVEEQAGTSVATCPQCAAGRAKHDGLTTCAYCGFEYTQAILTEGIHIRTTDNSRKGEDRPPHGQETSAFYYSAIKINNRTIHI